MKLNQDQKGVVRGILLALAFIVMFLGLGYLWFPVALGPLPGVADRVAFALRADVFVLSWLLAAVARVSNTRFYSPDDIGGSGLSAPSERIRVPLGILQNTLEQCVLAIGAHLALATVLEANEMALIPLLVVLFGIGRLAFWLGYKRGAGGRSFGFATTFYPTLGAYLLCVVLLVLR